MAALVALVAVVNPTSGHAQPPVTVTASSVTGSDGTVVTATNHLVQTGHPTSGEYLVVWAGDENAADNSAAELVNDATRPAMINGCGYLPSSS